MTSLPTVASVSRDDIASCCRACNECWNRQRPVASSATRLTKAPVEKEDLTRCLFRWYAQAPTYNLALDTASHDSLNIVFLECHEGNENGQDSQHRPCH